MEEENPLEVLSRAASIVQDLEFHDDRNKRQVALDSHVPIDPVSTKCRKDLSDAERQKAHITKKFKLHDTSCSTMNRNDDVDLDENDRPLDMSLGKSGDSSSSHSYENGLNYYPRPSVITCVSALRNPASVTPSVLSDLAITSKDGSSDNITSDCEDARYSRESDCVENNITERRRQVFSEACDPVIDEHFRRSLGKDYQTLFSTKMDSATNNITITSGQAASDATGMSVDDHFAKALGDTWLRLQSKDKDDDKDDGLNNNSQSKPSLLSSRSGLVTT